MLVINAMCRECKEMMESFTSGMWIVIRCNKCRRSVALSLDVKEEPK